jgi:hypothetical protein
VKNDKVNGKICLQGYFKRVFEISFTAVHKAMPKCMPEESLAPWQSDES